MSSLRETGGKINKAWVKPERSTGTLVSRGFVGWLPLQIILDRGGGPQTRKKTQEPGKQKSYNQEGGEPPQWKKKVSTERKGDKTF